MKQYKKNPFVTQLLYRSASRTKTPLDPAEVNAYPGLLGCPSWKKNIF
ncbi:Hypothetical protein Minf_0496 [Methylacidiphilum infernorum V4]|uniref:Uncharacterized protein n=1 Tax=Methylacidiphilum infernorum (isolate V4) TaxID=481448 RepID=B3DZD7_METI4|nr:Hypothetical protein Minf_0496 [Methylacidiphilum infernorum V4]